MTMWLDYIGKFHPVVVHLPIGALLFTLLMVLLALKQYTTYSKAIKLGLVFSFFGALVSSSLGYVLYRSGGYEATAVQSHLILGWVSTASLAVLWYLFERVAFHRVFFPLFMMSTLAIGLTGHFGGQLTHGEEYFALPTPAPPPARVNLDSIQLYSQVVAQIFDKKCVSCHNFSKRKGGLALHQPQTMLEGGERGLPFEMNNATESRIITYAQLPIEDDLHMPPQGRPQLTSSEIQLLSYWIDQGATFDTSAPMETFPEEVQTVITQFLPKELPDVGPLKISALEALQAAQFRVSSHLADTPFIQAKFEGKTINRSVLKALDAAAEQIVVLELPKMELPQNLWPQLKKLTNLQKLRLDGTNIQDAQLTHLTELPLRSLNLV
ncbi:MAG: c-type cytochrome domain-containing protein, partial [Flavobacteriaceae bacterium]